MKAISLGVIILPLAGCGISASRHATAALTNADSDAIMAGARGTLATNDGAGDVACSVSNLERRGEVTSFTDGTGIIDDEADYHAVLAHSGDVKVVSQINWCGTIAPNWLGCSPTPGPSLIVVRVGLAEGILWAHEYGHSKGLPHRSNADALMNPILGLNHKKVDNGECHAIRN